MSDPVQAQSDYFLILSVRVNAGASFTGLGGSVVSHIFFARRQTHSLVNNGHYGVTYRMGGLLQEYKWLKDSCITEAYPLPEVTAHKSWGPRAQCTAFSQLNRLESMISSESVGLRQPDWSQAAWLISGFFAAWLVWELLWASFLLEGGA